MKPINKQSINRPTYITCFSANSSSAILPSQAIPSISFFPIGASSKLSHVDFLVLFPALLRLPLLPHSARRLSLFLIDAIGHNVLSVDPEAVVSHARSNLEDGEKRAAKHPKDHMTSSGLGGKTTDDRVEETKDATDRICVTEPFSVLTLLSHGSAIALAEIDGDQQLQPQPQPQQQQRLDVKLTVLSNLINFYSRLTSQDVVKRVTKGSSTNSVRSASSSSVLSASTSSSASTSHHCPILLYYCVLMVDVAEVMRQVASSSTSSSTSSSASSSTSSSADVNSEGKPLPVHDQPENSASFLFLLETITAAKSLVSKKSESLKRQSKRHQREPEGGGGGGGRGLDQMALDRELKTFQTSVTRVIKLMINEKQKETIASLMLSA